MSLLVDIVHSPVPASSATAFMRRSYTASTGILTCRGSHSRHGAQFERLITNIACRVQVAVDHLPTCRAGPHPISQLQIILGAATAVVPLAGREEATNCDHLATIPFGLVAQLAMQFAQTGVPECLCQSPISEHPSHVQVLETNQRRLTRDPTRRLMLGIGAQIGYSVVGARQFV